LEEERFDLRTAAADRAALSVLAAEDAHALRAVPFAVRDGVVIVAAQKGNVSAMNAVAYVLRASVVSRGAPVVDHPPTATSFDISVCAVTSLW
jgi:hypothetical protein